MAAMKRLKLDYFALYRKQIFAQSADKILFT